MAGQSVQAVFFRRDVWTEEAAAAWCEEHDFIADSRHHDESHFIFRQWPPDDAVAGSWATLADDFPEGIFVTVAKRREEKTIKYQRGELVDPVSKEFVLSDGSVDRVGDVIDPKGWDLAAFKANPVALFGHDHSKIVGKWESVRVEGGKLMGRLKLAKKGTSQLVDEVRALVEQGILKAVSVGFTPVEYKPRKGGGYLFSKSMLSEVSLVAVPANPMALATAKAFTPNAELFFENDAVKSDHSDDLVGEDESVPAVPRPHLERAKSILKQWEEK